MLDGFDAFQASLFNPVHGFYIHCIPNLGTAQTLYQFTAASISNHCNGRPVITPLRPSTTIRDTTETKASSARLAQWKISDYLPPLTGCNSANRTRIDDYRG
jgi:hypothetical protein